MNGGFFMKRQNEMMESFMLSHREFMNNLEKSIHILDQEIDEGKEMTEICTDEWCLAVEHAIDELANMIYSISEPRWVTPDDSATIKNLRHKIHDLYARYKGVRGNKK
jgi:hypothetical protein